ncbi:hypothetical protein A2U01_0044870, partial [Trifolium medium]|nr:hypothetical protein [Trifolium medium]
RTPAPSTRRLRCNAGKSVPVYSVPVKTTKEKKIYGLKRQWSKVTGSSEPKKKLFKRKTISSSDSEFEEDQHATTSPASSSKKSVKKKRIPQDVSPVPIDNISFHHVENVDSRIDENCNWALTTHSNTLATDIKSCAVKMPIAFPTLMGDIVLAQHPGICTE